MGLTQVNTDGVKDDAISLAKQAAGIDGKIITYDANGHPVAVGPGTDGQVLTSTGAGSPPAFEDVPAGGATINNATENEIVTVASNTAQLDAEANLTFDGTQLSVTGSAAPPVYIGGANPGIKFEDTDASGTPLSYIYASDGQLSLRADDGDETGSSLIEFKVDGTERLRIDSSAIQLPDGSAGSPSFTWKDEGNLDTGIFRPGANTIGFSTAGSERMRIVSGGDVYVGTTTGNTGTSNFGVYLASHGAINNSRDVNGNSAVHQSYGNAGELRVLGDGDCQNTNNSYGQISDQTLKQDIVDAASQWNDIKQVKVRKFRFKDNPTAPLQIGVVAQELETISPGLVKEVYENGNDGNKVKAVKYSVLYMKAIKALQEAMAKIETLETKVAALEAG